MNANNLALQKAEANERIKNTLQKCKEREDLTEEFFSAYEDYNTRLQEFQDLVYQKSKQQFKNESEYQEFRNLQLKFSKERNQLREEKFKPLFKIYEQIINAESTFTYIKNDLDALERLPTRPSSNVVGMYPTLPKSNKPRRSSFPSLPGKGLFSRITNTFRRRSKSFGGKRKTNKRKH